MADAAVGFVVEKLGALIVQEVIDLHGVSGHVETLKQELQQMQCFLKDADAKKNKGDGESVKNWVSQMRDLAFDAEDTIDTYMYFKLRREQKQSGRIGFIMRFVFVFDELVSRRKVHADVEGIKAKLHQLSQRRELFGIVNIGEIASHSKSQDEIPILPQLKDDIDMVGFDVEKKKIVQELLDVNNTLRSVVSIFGMGGLGKTTLAKSVYNDPEVKSSFKIFGWVIISQEYTILEILKRISSEVSATSERDTVSNLSIAISEKLKKERYLLVLDDVWKEDVWEQLKKVLPDVDNGSRVIITTRSSEVASFPGPITQSHELRLLNLKESWELFLHKVFPRQDIETCCPEALVDVAYKLVQRCGGLPLALVVLGGLVSTKPQTQEAWQKIVESIKGQFVMGGKRCLDILAFSYYDLPVYLKSCFLYFGCFREDMSIPAKTLIRLWSAEGFLPIIPTKDGTSTEELGENCLLELAQRCLIQVTERKYDGRAKECRIHDLLRDMCIDEAKDNNYLEIYQNDHNVHSASRRLIICNRIETLNYSNSKLRGLFYSGSGFGDFLPFKALNGCLTGFKLLRVLCLMNVDGVSEFPSEIKSLIHLRYLELGASFPIGIKEVPSWIGHLRNLQTFILQALFLHKSSSNSLWTIESLRHVDLRMSNLAEPPKMGNTIVLKNLQTLKIVNAGEWIGNMLPKLTSLKTLHINNVSADHADTLSSSLEKLGHLASLQIQGDDLTDNIITAFANQQCLKKLNLVGDLQCKQLPRNDFFPQKLVKLILNNSGLEQDPMATLEKLQFLKYLDLFYAYTGEQMVCSARGFPQLLELTIHSFDELEEWRIEKKAMPSLKFLRLMRCPGLKKIPEGLKHVQLVRLKMFNMSKELKTRVKENTGEDWYKIKHVPNIDIQHI